MSRTGRRLTCLAALGAALGVAACAQAGSSGTATPDRVVAVVLPYLTQMPFYIAEEEGYFADEGLEVEFLRLGRNQDIMAALAHGDVDVAAGMLSVNELGLVASGSRLRLVAAMGQIDADDCTVLGFVARRELIESGALQDPERSRSLQFDVPFALPFLYFLDSAIKPMGLEIDDLLLVDVPPTAAVESLRQGAIDVSGDAEPFLSRHRRTGTAEVWWAAEEHFPGFISSVLMFGPTLIDERPEVGERFVTALLRAMKQFREGKTPRNLEVVEQASGLESDLLSEVCWPRPPDDGRIPPDGFAGYIEWAAGRGLISRAVDMTELVDHRFIDAANAAVGR